MSEFANMQEEIVMEDVNLSKKSTEELEKLAAMFKNRHTAEREARKIVGGADTDTRIDDSMRECLRNIRLIDEELMKREG